MCNAGDRSSILESGRSPGEGNGNPLQYSCLENPMDRGAWWATVHGVARVRHDLASRPRLPPPQVPEVTVQYSLGPERGWKEMGLDLTSWIGKATLHNDKAATKNSNKPKCHAALKPFTCTVRLIFPMTP